METILRVLEIEHPNKLTSMANLVFLLLTYSSLNNFSVSLNIYIFFKKYLSLSIFVSYTPSYLCPYQNFLQIYIFS